jgi:hypothetical protein
MITDFSSGPAFYRKPGEIKGKTRNRIREFKV